MLLPIILEPFTRGTSSKNTLVCINSFNIIVVVEILKPSMLVPGIGEGSG